MSAYVPTDFLQTDMKNNGKDRVIMKIRGILVDMLLELNAELYE
jgi:hypothetical protein